MFPDMDADEALKLDNQFCFVVYALSRKIIGQYRPLLSAIELTYPQYLVMLVLWEHLPNPAKPGGVTIKFIGERLMLDTGTLTPLLKRLEQRGLIHRERAKDDEREVLVRLSLEGIELKQKAKDIPFKVMCDTALPLDEVLKLKEALKVMLALDTEPAIQSGC
ncbi:MarR family winged helix-turn-helix transcriptional regulator [Ketobacter nezhaii]|uniref:MarR family winged helix-turn-helix transcriptional regulator n=1 Tax=Ketobacter sp. MCCC 1A13808 TaxID=2602738 RepID=UPI0018DBB401|nr:MarR family transcriptional regulator [Ketobacter sp. MCCC 1A13808]